MINISRLYCGLAGESDDLRYRKSGSSGPVIAYNCTARCNLNCLHCYSSSRSTAGNNELTTQQAKQVLHQLSEASCPVVLFSGGEPLLRADLYELLAEAKALNLRTALSTNGTLIDSQAASKLAETGIGYVGVSIDGGEDFHDQFRRAKGSFKAALTAIENCRKASLRTGLRFTILKGNVDQVSVAFDIAASAGVRRICFYHLIRTGRAVNLDGQTPSADQTRRVLDVIIDRTAEFAHKGLIDEVLTVDNHADGPYLLVRMRKEDNARFEEAEKLLLANGGNRVGERIACIGWDGSIYPDQFWRNYSLGNVREKPFAQIWQDTGDPVLYKLRHKDEFADARCLKCTWFTLCKGNYRFLGKDSADKNWLNEPACYLTDNEIIRTAQLSER